MHNRHSISEVQYGYYVCTSHPRIQLHDLLLHNCSGLWGLVLAYDIYRAFRSRPSCFSSSSTEIQAPSQIPQAISTAFENHPALNHGSRLGIVGYILSCAYNFFNFALNGTFIDTRHVCHTFRHFVSFRAYECSSLRFVLFLLSYNYSICALGKFRCNFHSLLHSQQLFL
jgi:hypothetical protein